MENQERTMRPIPKNVRQIGERDEEIRLYIEDYVNTFIRKCARADKLVLGALIGDCYIHEGKEYLFVEGAVQADSFQTAGGRIQMTDEAWSGLYGKIEQFFQGRSICGWFICSGEAENCNVGMIRSFMYENIGQDKRALIIHNGELEEESFSVYDQNFIREQQGYYLFYERNEAMQSYMVTTSFAGRTDPVAVDAVTANVRTRLVEKRDIPERRTGYSFVSAAALIIGVIALASGIVMMNHYEQLREIETVLTNLTGSLLSSQGSPGQGDEDGQSSEQKSGGLIIEDISGNVTPTESSPADESEPEQSADGSTDAASEGQQSAEGQETSPAETGEASPGESTAGGTGALEGTVSGSEPKDENPASEANATAGYRTYLVEKGETLVTICWRVYGYRDDELIDKICEINNLVDKDHIYAGQELLIP